MELSKGVEPVTVLKTKSAELIRKARETGQPIVITQNGKATAVLQDIESFERMRRALLMLKYVSTGNRELSEGKGIPQRDAAERVRRKLRELQGE